MSFDYEKYLDRRDELIRDGIPYPIAGNLAYAELYKPKDFYSVNEIRC